MTARSRTILEGYFNTGDKPTEAQFAELIESFYHKDDLGWADYIDSQYTAASPLVLVGGVPALINNDGVDAVTVREPLGIDLYDTVGRKITGINGESRLITVEFKIKPTTAAATSGEVWFDIGGAVGELYRRIFTFPKGSGIERNVVQTSAVYTLDTWEANGAEVWIESDGPCEVYDVRYVIVRTSKVF